MTKKLLALFVVITILCTSTTGICLASSEEELKCSFDFDSYDYTDPSLMSKEGLDSGADDIRNHFPTDEEFFGKWNSEEETWENEPKLDYSHVSQYGGYTLEETERYVKSGDYEGAKTALLEYYRSMNSKRGIKALTSDTQKEWQAKLLLNNIHYYASSGLRVGDIVQVSEDWEEVSADVLEEVQYFMTRDGTLMGILLMALEKDGYEAQFASKENSLGTPYIELVVNGMTERIYPEEDTYTAAGENNNENYSSEDILRVEETVGEWKSEKLQDPVGSDTKRGNLLFSLAKFSAGDTITSARLKMKARWVDNNYPQKEDSSYKKDVIVFSSTQTAWTETEKTWMTNSNIVFSYQEQDGMPWIQPSAETNPEQAWEEVLYRLNPWLPNIASVYYTTKNEIYAQTVFLLLHNFILNTYCAYRGKPGGWEYPAPGENVTYSHLLEHGGYSVSLDLSVRGTALSNNLIYFYDSEYLTPELFTVFLKYIWSMGDLMSRFWGPNEIGGNWGAYGLNGFFSLMSYYPELVGAKDEWRAIFEERLESYTQSIHLTGGSSPEGSLSYAKGIYNNLYTIQQLADLLNVEFPINDTIKKRISTLARFVVYMSNPWGGDPQYGDGSHYYTSVKNSILDIANWVDDDQIRWYATNGKIGTPMENTSIFYPDSRRIAFRSSWDEDALWLNGTVDGGNAQRWHSHWHDGAVTLAAYGDYLLVDPMYNNYTSKDLNTRWLASSGGHNTVEINGYDNKGGISNLATAGLPRNGKPGSFTYTEMNDSYDFTRMWTPNAKDITYPSDYPFGDPPPTEPGMDWYRNILMLKSNKFVIVSDHLDPVLDDIENTYTQLWHTLPDVGLHIDGQYVLQDGESVGDTSGELDTQIENTHFVRGTGTGAFKTNIRGESNVMIVPGDIDSVEPKLMRGLYSPGKDGLVSTEYALFEQKATGSANFDTILFPVEAGKDFEIVTAPLNVALPQAAASAFSANIKDVSGKTNEDYNFSYFLLHDTANKGDVSFGDYATDGILAYYEKEQNNTPRVAIMKNATYVKNAADDYELVYTSGEEIEDLSVAWNGSRIEINTTKDIALEDLTIYAPAALSSVKLNGVNVENFEQKSNYVYFGDEPILDGALIPDVGDSGSDSSDSSGNTSNNDSGGTSGGNPGSNSGQNTNDSHGSKTPANNQQECSSSANAPQTENTPSVAEKYEEELKNHWGREEILPLIEKGIVQGDGESLRLSATITRAEFIALIIRAMGLDVSEYEGAFADVTSDDWYSGILQTAYENKIMEGDGSCALPNDFVTREQAVKIMMKAAEQKTEITYEESAAGFNDDNLISDWAKPFVSKAVSLQLIQGTGEGLFDPKGNLLREQGMAIVYRIMNFSK